MRKIRPDRRLKERFRKGLGRLSTKRLFIDTTYVAMKEGTAEMLIYKHKEKPESLRKGKETGRRVSI